MSSFVSLLAILALSPPVPVPAVPPALEARVAAAVAERWVVAPAAVRLDWGAFPRTARLRDDTRFRLLGRGDGGWFAVLFEPDSGQPVASRLRAGVLDSVPVAARPLSPGAVLDSADLRLEARIRWTGPLRAAPLFAAAGWVTRRPLAAGDLLIAPSVSPPPAVRAGAPVRVEWQRNGIAISLDGTALSDAPLGGAVRVRVAGRGQRSGIVTAPHLVRLD